MTTSNEVKQHTQVCTVCDGTGKVEREVKQPCIYGGTDWDVPVIQDCECREVA